MGMVDEGRLVGDLRLSRGDLGGPPGRRRRCRLGAFARVDRRGLGADRGRFREFPVGLPWILWAMHSSISAW